jgi:SAM-dependent methyltransferase
MVPPKRIRPDYVVSSGFTEHGESFAQLVIELGKIGPDGHILDLGCGIGRVAVPMTKFLSDRGRYDGLDIVPESISWCQKEISSRYPNFIFQVADVHNSQYNPGGTQTASEYRFPYGDEKFDLIFLKSVFTHMLPEDVEHYTKEIMRTLKTEGRALITLFLLNEVSLAAMEERSTKRDFNYVFDN